MVEQQAETSKIYIFMIDICFEDIGSLPQEKKTILGLCEEVELVKQIENLVRQGNFQG